MSRRDEVRALVLAQQLEDQADSAEVSFKELNATDELKWWGLWPYTGSGWPTFAHAVRAEWIQSAVNCWGEIASDMRWSLRNQS